MSGFVQRLRMLPAAAEALCWLTVAWLTLDVLPGRLYRKLLPKPQNAAQDEIVADQRPGPRILHLRRVIWAVSRRMPVRSVCFHRAIAAHWMLRRRGIPSILHYGVAKDAEGGLLAHVWVTSNRLSVIGVPEARGYTEIAILPSHPHFRS